MNRKKVIVQVMLKLADDKSDRVVDQISTIYKRHKNTKFEDTSFPKDILKFIGAYMDEEHPNEKDKLEILKKLKKGKFFNFTLNKNLERAWRLILKNWGLSRYRLEGGI